MQEILVLNKVPVEILYHGRISPTKMLKTKIQDRPKELVLFIPGIPGIVQDYSRFGEQLWNKLKMPLWQVGYGGASRDIPLPRPPKNNFELYDMHAQILQKKELILKYLEGVSICLVAHSLGCCFSLELMKDDLLSKQFNSVYFIFPMFQDAEKLAIIPRCAIVLNSIKPCLKYAEPIFKLLFLSSTIRKLFAAFVSYRLNLPRSEDVPNMFQVDLLWCNVANTESSIPHTVGTPYNQILKRNSRKIKILLTKGDPFQTETFGDDIRKAIPGLWVEYVQFDIPHSFHHVQNKALVDVLSRLIKSDRMKRIK